MKMKSLPSWLCYSLLALLLLAATQSATAAPPQPEWMKWDVETAFYGAPVAKLTVYVGHYDNNGDPVPTYSQTDALYCNTVGSVSYQNGYADFSGGYITCNMPDLADIADEMITKIWGSQAQLHLSPLDNGKQFLAYAKAGALPLADGENPIFYHPDVTFGVPTDQDFSANSLRVGTHSDTGQFGQVNGLTTFFSSHICDSSNNVCDMQHEQNGNLLGGNSLPYANQQFTTAKTDIFIGFDPTTGKTFTGEMDGIVIDPGYYFDGVG